MTSNTVPWIVFAALIVTLLVVDLGVLGRRGQVMTPRTALAWSALWIGFGLSFSLAVWAWRGAVAAQEYLAAYLIEESLSVDNLFVFMLVFGGLGIALQYQRKVLFWGILGAIVMRGLFIFGGVAAIERFHWVMYVFGVLLLLAAAKMLRSREIEVDPSRNPLVRIVSRLVPIAVDYRGSRFTTRRARASQGTALMLTPLALALVAVESADVVFAIDSVPAVLAISSDSFVVYTSNICAVLGLRSLYFALAGSLERFRCLGVGLAAVLGFVAVKMLLSEVLHVPVVVSLGVIVCCVGGAIGYSLLRTSRECQAPGDAPAATRPAQPEPVAGGPD